MKIPQELWVFLSSLSVLGVLYIMNNVPALQEPWTILGTGVFLSGLVFLLTYLSVLQTPPKDLLFYVCVQFSFASVMRLTNALEQDGFTSGFMEFYLKKGEPYMVTSYAVMMCYWDGVVHFILQLLLVQRMSEAKRYRGVGLFWAGSSFASTAVFLPGVIIGKYGSNIRPAFWMNMLLLLGSVWALASLLSRTREWAVLPADKVEAEQKKSLLSRPADCLLLSLLLGAMSFTVFRGFLVLDCPLDSCFTYLYQYEPYLKAPVGYPRITMLLFLFYGLPLMAAFAYGLSTPGCTWMLDLTVLFAGFTAQAQWCHMGASLHPLTPFTYRIPDDVWRSVLLANLAYTAIPLLLSARCVLSPAFFMRTTCSRVIMKEKKTN